MPCRTCVFALEDREKRRLCAHPDGFQPDIELFGCSSKTESTTLDRDIETLENTINRFFSRFNSPVTSKDIIPFRPR